MQGECPSTEGPGAIDAVAGLTPWSWAGRLKGEGLEAGSNLSSVVKVCERNCRADLGATKRDLKVCPAVLRPEGQSALASFTGTATGQPSTSSLAEAGPPLHCHWARIQHNTSYVR